MDRHGTLCPVEKSKGPRPRFSKGDATIEAVLAITMGVCIVLAAAPASRILNDMLKMLNANSAEAVARDLGGIITIAGSAQDEVTITYQASSQFSYDLTIKDRLVNISNIRKDGELIVGESSIINTGTGKTAVDPEGDFTGVNVFTITKIRAADCDLTKVCDAYQISAAYEPP
jgi:hypothetical protein